MFFTVVACDIPPEACPQEFKENGKPSAENAFEFFKKRLSDNTPLRLGGDEGTGRGYLRVRWYCHGTR